jgi:glycosyltransferase involved in cell wall biosynthesis
VSSLQRCVVQVAPVLPQDVKNQLLALVEAELLRTAVTAFSYAEGGVVDQLLAVANWPLTLGWARKAEARRVDRRLAPFLRWRIWGEVVHQVRLHLWTGARGPVASDAYLGAVDRKACRSVGPEARLVVAREDACLATFQAARQVGGLCLYDLPTTHYDTVRRIMAREEAEFPGASLEHEAHAQEYRPARNSRKDHELATADHVLVPSTFVCASLIAAGVSRERISVIPFGCQPGGLAPNAAGRQNIVLAVGHLSLRKGTPRLLRAWKRLGAHRTHRLRLIGRLGLAPKFLADYAGVYEHVPRLPRNELGNHYASARALVMPACAEGLAVVITEALSFGLPVIASENSGAGDIISSGGEGLLYPFGDDDKLCAALDYVLSHPKETAVMGQAAFRRAQLWTWQHYRDAFLRVVWQLLAQPGGGVCSGKGATKGGASLADCQVPINGRSTSAKGGFKDPLPLSTPTTRRRRMSSPPTRTEATPRPSRVLLCLTSLDPTQGGIAAVNRNVMRALHAMRADGLGIEIRALTYHGETPRPGPEEGVHSCLAASEGFSNLSNLRSSSGTHWRRWRFLLRYLRLCLSWRPHLVFVDHLHLAVVPYLSSWLMGPRYVLFCHGTEFDEAVSPLRRAAFHGAAQRLSNSQFTAGRLRSLFPGVSVEPCELGLEEATFTPLATTEPGPFPDAFGLPRPLGRRAVLIVGRLSESERYKGHDQLIAVLPGLLARNPDAQLVIVGDGDDRERLKALARDGGVGRAVLFAGFVPPAVRDALFARCCLFAMPSGKEGFGLVYLEAMRFGRPCIASRWDGGAEVVVDERTGLLVDRNDLRDLGAAVARLLEDSALADRLGRAGRERLNQYYRFAHFRGRLQKRIAPLLPGLANESCAAHQVAGATAGVGSRP